MSRPVALMCTLLSAAHAPRATADPPGPWANKLFAGADPAGPAPPVVAHDFGAVPHGTACGHTFVLVNPYDVPLQVVGVRTSSGCLTVDPPRQVLRPLGRADLAVGMDAGKFTGPNSQTVYVTFGPTHVSTAVLRLTADSRADVRVSPGRVDFGHVPAGTAASRSVTVEYAGQGRPDWKVTAAAPTAGPLTVALTDARGPLGGRPRFVARIGLPADARPGPVAEVVTLTTNDPAHPAVRVAVAGAVRPPLAVAPDEVRFAAVRVGDRATLRLRVEADGKPFRLTAAVDPGHGLSVDTFPFAAPVHVATVTFAPTAAGAFRTQLRLATSRGAVTTVPVAADAVAP